MSSPGRSNDTPPPPTMPSENEAGPSSGAVNEDSDPPRVLSEPSLPMSSSTNDPASATGTETTLPQPNQAGGLPRIPWTTRIPSFFVMGPNGTLIPQFAPTIPRPNPLMGPSPSAVIPEPAADREEAPDPSPAANPDNTQLPQPRPTVLPPGLPPFFPFFLQNMFGSRERQPDPEAAAELLRSLPTVEKGLFHRVERVIVAEQVQDGDVGEEKGWRCGICLEGVEEGAKETGVKVLPCNHLFHGDCLEPWLRTNHSW